MATLKTGGNKSLVTTSQGSPNGKQDLSSIRVKHLTKSEIESLRQSKVEAYEKMMKLPL